ncbi:Thyroid adenoma-associated protein, partial [Trichoplax sp. H2]
MLLEVKMDDHLPLFVSHSPVTDEILKFIWESINDPIDGVSYHVKNIFSLLLLVHSLECKLRQIPENDEFVRELINKTLMISWQSKGRYALLHCIIKQAGPKVVLNIDKTLPFALSRCLSINSLASISCDIYKTFLNDLQVGLLINPKQYARLNEYYRYQHSQALKILVMHFIRINQFISRFAYAKCHIKSEDIISSWATAWIDPIINGLFDDEDTLLRHNMRIYWLPATLSIISNSLHQLLDASELRFNNMNSKCPSARATLRHIHAKVMIYNAAKALDIIHVTELPEELLDSSLQCWDDDIRMDAISLLCFCQKRADGLTDMEIKFLRQYLPLNFNSDNAAFRQRLLASLKVLLERIRDSSLSMFKEYRLLRKRQLAGSDEFRILNQRIMTNIEVLDWLFNCSIECLNPDSSFQRSITGLKICSLIFQIIASTWNPDKRKGQPPGTREIGLLIGAIVDTVPLCTIKFEMDKSAKDSQGFLKTEDVEEIGDMFIKLLTKCRHKARSKNKFSAGLPLLIQSILSSEPQNAKKTLLRLSMKTLELVTRRPIGEEYDETTDLPQTHALYVMKVLYRDSSLGGDVLCYAADGVKCAIQGLRNPIWTIRNASMHLYGALVSRLFGQKRVRDEHSNYNNTQAAEFFSRYPSLKPFLLDELKLAFEDGEVRRTAWIHGGVYPALIILSKLQQDEEIDSTNPLQDFIPLLMKLLSAALLQLRDLAARSVAAFISKSKCLDTAIKLLRDINEMPSQNHVHGTLITVYHLAINILQLRDYSRISDSNVMTLYNEVLNHI